MRFSRRYLVSRVAIEGPGSTWGTPIGIVSTGHFSTLLHKTANKSLLEHECLDFLNSPLFHPNRYSLLHAWVPLLETPLSSETFLDHFARLGTVEALYSALRKSREVRSLNSAIREELIGEAELDPFVRSLLQRFVPGEQFEYQLSLAAISVACVGINKSFAREFVSYLAHLRAIEMWLASQVAEQALQFIPATISKTISENSSIDEVRLVGRLHRSDASQTTVIFGEDLVDA